MLDGRNSQVDDFLHAVEEEKSSQEDGDFEGLAGQQELEPNYLEMESFDVTQNQEDAE